MRPSLLPIPALLLASACGAGSSQPVATVEVAAPAPPPAVAAEAPAPLPPMEPSIPAGSALIVSIDSGKLDAILDGMMGDADMRKAIARALNLEPGALSKGALAKVLALDPAQPAVGSLWLTGGAMAAIERLRALQGHPPPAESLPTVVREAMGGTAGAAVAMRLVLPSTDVAVTLRAAAERMARKSWKAETPPEGFDRLYASPETDAFTAIFRTPSSVIVDSVFPVDDGDRKLNHSGAIETLRTLRRRAPDSPHDEVPRLEGAVARARYAPAAMADVAFLDHFSTLLGPGASGSSGADRGSVLQQGLDEAVHAYALAGDARGAYFDRIEVWLEGGYGTIGGGMRAVPGPAAPVAEAAWAPAVAPAIPNVFAWLDVSVPWLRGWTSPGVSPQTLDRVTEAIRQAGAFGNVVALPHLLAATVWQGMTWFQPFPGLVGRLERTAVFVPDEHGSDAYIGVFVQGTTPADAACALVEPPAPCTPDKRLRPGAAVKVDDRWVKLAQVKGRWTVVAGTDKAVVEKTKIDFGAEPAPPVRLVLPGGAALASQLPPLPAGLFPPRNGAWVSLEAGQPTVRVRPVPVP